MNEPLRQAVEALDNFLAMPRGAEISEVRDFRHGAYRLWEPILTALAHPPAGETPT